MTNEVKQVWIKQIWHYKNGWREFGDIKYVFEWWKMVKWYISNIYIIKILFLIKYFIEYYTYEYKSYLTKICVISLVGLSSVSWIQHRFDMTKSNLESSYVHMGTYISFCSSWPLGFSILHLMSLKPIQNKLGWWLYICACLFIHPFIFLHKSFLWSFSGYHIHW